jgi:predicted adenylyl cyclase CyaB
MRFEIEMKARVQDPGAARSRLEAFASFVRSFDKSDRYFLLPGAEPGQGRNFRVRTDGEGAFVTWKSRSKSGSMEVNLERECLVDDPDALIDLFLAMGAKPYFEKRKIGREYSYGGLTVELSEVPPLGHFIEIEYLGDAGAETQGGKEASAGPGEGLPASPDPALVESVRERELAVLARVGIPESSIEERPYSAMLLSLRA